MRTAIIFAVLIVLGGTAPSLAQRRGGGGLRGGGGRGGAAVGAMTEQGALLLYTALLDLTDAQRQQVQSAFDAAAQAAAPLTQQTTASVDAFYQAVKSGAGDDQIRALATEQGTRTTAIAVLQAQAFAKVWAVLTDAQKPKADVSLYKDIGEFLTNPYSMPMTSSAR
jgi:Spy/CpxP family protein refolding chaperone